MRIHINIHDLSNLTISPTTPWYLENINHPNDIYIYNSPKAEAPATIAQHRRAVVFMVDRMTANCVLGGNWEAKMPTRGEPFYVIYIYLYKCFFRYCF